MMNDIPKGLCIDNFKDFNKAFKHFVSRSEYINQINDYLKRKKEYLDIELLKKFISKFKEDCNFSLVDRAQFSDVVSVLGQIENIYDFHNQKYVKPTNNKLPEGFIFLAQNIIKPYKLGIGFVYQVKSFSSLKRARKKRITTNLIDMNQTVKLLDKTAPQNADNEKNKKVFNYLFNKKEKIIRNNIINFNYIIEALLEFNRNTYLEILLLLFKEKNIGTNLSLKEFETSLLEEGKNTEETYYYDIEGTTENIVLILKMLNVEYIAFLFDTEKQD